MPTNDMERGIARPTTQLYIAMKNLPMTYLERVCEFIDNSLDANAEHVHVRAYKDGQRCVIEVEDDGNGCDRMERFFSTGNHYPHSDRQLGRYGYGATAAFTKWWGDTLIESRKDGWFYTASVNWDLFTKEGDFSFSQRRVACDPSSHGTLVRSTYKGRLLPESIIDQLGFTYSRAIEAGKVLTIKFNNKREVQVPPFAEPTPKIDAPYIDEFFDVDGKAVHVTAYVVADPSKNTRYGFNYFHEYRCLMSKSYNGAGPNVNLQCFYGKVDLGREWDLGTFKADITDELCEELYAEIKRRTRAVLDAAKQQADTAQVDLSLKMLMEGLNVVLANKNDGTVQQRHKNPEPTPREPRGRDAPQGVKVKQPTRPGKRLRPQYFPKVNWRTMGEGNGVWVVQIVEDTIVIDFNEDSVINEFRNDWLVMQNHCINALAELFDRDVTFKEDPDKLPPYLQPTMRPSEMIEQMMQRFIDSDLYKSYVGTRRPAIVQ